MNQAQNHLYDVLCEERSLYQAFLTLSQQKTDVILAGDTAGLESIIQAEQGLIQKAGAMERARAQALDALTDQGALNKPVALSEVIAMIPEAEREALETVRQELQNLLTEQQQINALNGRLLKNNLEYIRTILEKTRGSSEDIHLMDTSV